MKKIAVALIIVGICTACSNHQNEITVTEYVSTEQSFIFDFKVLGQSYSLVKYY